MKAALLDALGTLVELERPWPHLVAELRARGVAVSEEDARRAMLAEMAYYKRHHDDARDLAGLKDLRRRCAGIVRAELGTALPVDDVEGAMLAAIRFRPYPEVPGVLAALGARGVARVVVSNWDVSLHDVLERTRLRPLLDAVVTSAEFGAAKPDPSIFRHALGAGGRARRPRPSTRETTSRRTSRAPGPRGSRPCSSRATACDAPPGVRTVRTLEALLAG